MDDNKITNNRYGSVEYGTESLNKNSTISILSAVSSNYEESTTDDMESLYVRRELDNDILAIYKTSPYYEKYGQTLLEKKNRIRKGDEREIYEYFRRELMATGKYTLVQVFCVIVEFFGYGNMDDHKEYKGYKHMFDDVISLDDKKDIMTLLRESHNIKKHLNRSYSLF